MKIDKEKFNSLKQLDRIEYQQKVEIIKNFNSSSWGTTFLFLFVLIIAFIMILIPQGYSAFGIEFVLDLVGASSFFLGFISVLIILGYSIDFLFYLMRKKNLAELEEEYFSVEVKK